jgi:hypothetical protein
MLRTLDSTVIRTALSASALASKYTAQMPSACPITGILVEFCMLLTSSLPPRGMTRSMYRSWASRDEISDLVATDWMKVGGMDVVSRARAINEDKRVAV